MKEYSMITPSVSTPKSALNLLDIPPQLLTYIFEFLSRKEYHSLAQTNHFINKKVTPRLYRDLRFEATGSGSCARRLAYLLRTLLEKANLGLHVVSLRLSGPHLCWDHSKPWPGGSGQDECWGLDGCPILSKAQLLFVSNMLYRFVDDDMQQSQPQFRGRCADALAALVLTHLTNVRSLDLCEGFLRYSLFLPQLLKRANHLFPRLHHVNLGNKNFCPTTSVAYIDLNLIRPMFYSSSVVALECSMSQPWRFQWGSLKSPRSNTLTSLTLFRTNISRATLGELLSATPRLKFFHFEHEFIFNAATSRGSKLSPYLGLDELNTALFPIRDTLEECRFLLRLGPGSISATEYPLAGTRFPAVQGTLTMLKFMPRLVKIEVPMTMLLGWHPDFAAKLEEVLPHGIMDLTLRDDLIRYCPWVAPSNAEKKVTRIAEYIQGRAFHATQLESLKIRLTSAKRSLVHSVGALNISTTGRGSETTLVRGKKSETYGWRFKKAELPVADSTFAYHAARKDSGFRPMSPLFESYCSGANFF